MELRDVYYLNGVRFESSEPIQVTLTQGDCVSTLELSLDEEEVPPFFKNMKIEMSVEPVERKDGFPLFLTILPSIRFYIITEHLLMKIRVIYAE